MKTRGLMNITMMTLFAALAVPVGTQLAAQEEQHVSPPQHYTVTDLGTLGGTSSEGVGINNQGSIAGSARLIGDTKSHAVLWRGGVKTDLGTLEERRNEAAALEFINAHPDYFVCEDNANRLDRYLKAHNLLMTAENQHVRTEH